MAVDVVTETVINRPCAEVAEYATNPSHAPDWYANITSVEWLTPPPVRVGSRLAFVARFLRRTLAYTGMQEEENRCVRSIWPRLPPGTATEPS